MAETSNRVKWEYLKREIRMQRVHEPTGESDWLGNPKTRESWQQMGYFNGKAMLEGDALGLIGEEGWELVSALQNPHGGDLLYCFKRVKE